MTTANKVTIARILIVPVFVVEVLKYVNGGSEGHRLAAIGCFALAALGDALDGFIARRFHQQSDSGAILDPLADKLLLVSALVLLSLDSRQRLAPIPWWLSAIVVLRELMLLAGLVAIHLSLGKFVARPRFFGKLATILQMTVVLWALLQCPVKPLPFFIAGAALFTVLSGICYLYDFVRQWRGGGADLKLEVVRRG
jgi:CDP-diacylglycerol--glycerol-3-phosphate 3-phosphatidyltransferase